MREILFRGKRWDTGEWVEGDLLSIVGGREDGWRAICPQTAAMSTYQVDPETVGEYTGLTDRNGKKIFEGDILECNPGRDDHLRGSVKYGEWNCSCCHGVYGWVTDWHGDLRDPDMSEVVGNIWDTPNLLGGETQEGPDR